MNIDKRPSEQHNDITSVHDIRSQGIETFFTDKIDTVVLLAAEHRDDVWPVSLYYDVNVQGTQNVLDAMDRKGLQKIIFTSSVAIYGLNKNNPDENHTPDPFNHYGKSKWAAEEILRAWFNKDPHNRSVSIIRPTVIFGEGNRGNVFNLLHHIASGKFMMIGDGKNRKSMAYIGNVAAFIHFLVEIQPAGYQVYNYVDSPDYTMNELVNQVRKDLDKGNPLIRMPKIIGMIGGYAFDAVAKITGKKFSISRVRVQKFCANTQVSAEKLKQTGFTPPFTIQEGLRRTLYYEFIENHPIHKGVP